MTRVRFVSEGGVPVGFTVTGHTGLAEAGNDVLCAAVSSMTQLVINTLTDGFGLKATVETDPEKAFVSFRLCDPADRAAGTVLESFRRELEMLSGEYPRYLSVKEEKISERK